VKLAYIGLGSNLDGPVNQLDAAVKALGGLPGSRVDAVSPYYASPPMGPQDQPDFVNGAARLLTGLAPLELLDALQHIEQQQGRVRRRRWGERSLDLDLLLYGDCRLDNPRLRVPHPGLAERAFVLRPLLDLAPDLEVPGFGDIATLLSRVDTSGLQPIASRRGTPCLASP